MDTNGKTLKQMADELGIDKQKIYRFVSKNCINEAHQDNGTKYYDEEAQTLIYQHFDDISCINEVHQNHINEALIDAVMKQLEVLQQENEIKNQQIESLTQELSIERQHSRELADKVTVLADNAQQLQKGQLIQQLSDGNAVIENNNESKPNIFKRLFRSNNK